MIVSTLDGKVSALDLHNAGSVQWTLDTDIGPLMDSSISNLEVSITTSPYPHGRKITIVLCHIHMHNIKKRKKWIPNP